MMKNFYKFKNVFKCVHEVHRHFNFQMSPFHILKEKKCFPQGCMTFLWKCRLLAKQKKCFRNFTTVGKECFNCKYFYEEKLHQYPELLLNKQDGKLFFENFLEFEVWIENLKRKRILCEGKVSQVSPEFIIEEKQNNNRLKLKGFLILFREGYIDNQLFEDDFYLSISAKTQNQLKFRKDDEVEFLAQIQIDRGRIKFFKSGKFEFFERGKSQPPTHSQSLVNAETYTIIKSQPQNCRACVFGKITDVLTTKPGPKRFILC